MFRKRVLPPPPKKGTSQATPLLWGSFELRDWNVVTYWWPRRADDKALQIPYKIVAYRYACPRWPISCAMWKISCFSNSMTIHLTGTDNSAQPHSCPKGPIPGLVPRFVPFVSCVTLTQVNSLSAFRENRFLISPCSCSATFKKQAVLNFMEKYRH